MKIFLRNANKKDLKYIYKLRNEKEAMENSFDKKKIEFNEHKNWFNKKIKDNNSKILIAYNKKYEKIGIIRYDVSHLFAKVSINIENKFRNKGYGFLILKKSEKLLKKNLVLISKIKNDNLPSIKIFTQNKYKIFLKKKYFYLIKLSQK
jgi:hypothetical protein